MISNNSLSQQQLLLNTKRKEQNWGVSIKDNMLRDAFELKNKIAGINRSNKNIAAKRDALNVLINQIQEIDQHQIMVVCVKAVAREFLQSHNALFKNNSDDPYDDLCQFVQLTFELSKQDVAPVSYFCCCIKKVNKTEHIKLLLDYKKANNYLYDELHSKASSSPSSI